MAQTQTTELNLTDVLKQVAREKDIDMERWISALEDAMASAAKKQHRIKAPVKSKLDPETGTFEAFIVKTVAEEVEDPLSEWTVEEAQDYQPEAKVGDEIHIPISTEGLGRIAAQSAKQVLYQRIREAEREKIYNEYFGRIGEVLNGTVKRFERGDIVVDLGRTEAAVPRGEQSRHERYSQGERIRAVIVDVHKQPKGPQIILSRTDPRLLVKLFEMEVPEIYDGTVQIKAAVRAPGERAKVAVFSRERDVDPVGACVGMKGSRVQSIIRELRGEKIDIIEFSDDLVTFAQSALAPARITRVSVTHHGEEPHLDVIVEDEQLSLAIGKRGQNVRLAAELLGAKVDIKSETDVKDEVAGALAKMLQTAMDEDEASRPPAGFDILDAPGVGAKTAGKLVEAGLGTLEAVAQASPETLEAVEGVGPKTARAILAWAGNLAAAAEVEPAPPAEGAEEGAVETEVLAGVATEEGDGFMAALSRALEEAETQDALTKEVQAEAIEDADREAALVAAEAEADDGASETTDDAAEPEPADKPDEEPV
jgi:N utilization substance protein A